MKYALVNGERQEAQPKLPGKCICCDSTVIAKCGTVRVPHWAHKGMCDPWWEGETEWHRGWKEHFPKEWQEVVHFADNGEKHIADVKTDQELVIEFQHSPIKPEERHSRESFYKKMIWVVDGARRLRDKNKLINVLKQSYVVDDKIEILRLDYFFENECVLLREWNDSAVPVIFDLGDDTLWLFLPKIIKFRYAFRIRRHDLILYLLSRSQMSFEALLQGVNNLLKLKEELLAIHQNNLPQPTNYPANQREYNRYKSKRPRRF